MQRDVELAGGPLAGSQWPVRLEADQTLWIGIGADGHEYDGRSRLKAIAIYERAGSEESPRFDFARIEGPGARLAELGRRITRLRAGWASQRRSITKPTPAVGSMSQPPAARLLASLPVDAAHIAGRVFERWLRAVEALPMFAEPKVRIDLIVPGEAEQLQELLQRHGIAADVAQTSVEIRTGDSENSQTLQTGAVEVAALEIPRVVELLRGIVADA